MDMFLFLAQRSLDSPKLYDSCLTMVCLSQVRPPIPSGAYLEVSQYPQVHVYKDSASVYRMQNIMFCCCFDCLYRLIYKKQKES